MSIKVIKNSSRRKIKNIFINIGTETSKQVEVPDKLCKRYLTKRRTNTPVRRDKGKIQDILKLLLIC